MMITIFLDVTLYSVVDSFGSMNHFSVLKLETARSTKTLVTLQVILTLAVHGIP
jgi:hypothetical protein